jgi:hypothetical protein
MKRAAWLLLWLCSVWLLALPSSRLQQLQAPTRTDMAAASDGKTSAALEHVAAASAMPSVARAPVQARLPASPLALLSSRQGWQRVPPSRPPDLRQALRRVQTRRRVPRLSAGEPPWS